MSSPSAPAVVEVVVNSDQLLVKDKAYGTAAQILGVSPDTFVTVSSHNQPHSEGENEDVNAGVKNPSGRTLAGQTRFLGTALQLRLLSELRFRFHFMRKLLSLNNLLLTAPSRMRRRRHWDVVHEDRRAHRPVAAVDAGFAYHNLQKVCDIRVSCAVCVQFGNLLADHGPWIFEVLAVLV